MLKKVFKIFLIAAVFFILPSVPHALAQTGCTVTIGDAGSGSDYEVTHITDEVKINQAVAQVGSCATANQKGVVVLKQTVSPYVIKNPIRLNKQNVVLKGETTALKPNGDQTVTLIVSRDAPNLGFYPGLIAVETNNIEVRNLHLNGNVTPNYGYNGFWEGLDRYRGYEAIYVGIYRQNDSANPLPVSNILIQDISAFDTSSDVIFGTANNITIRNIRGNHIGHTLVDIKGFSPNTNLLIENLYCHDLVNACVRFRAMDGAVVRNVYADYYGGEPLPKSPTLPKGKPYYTQFVVEMWQEYANAPMQNIHFENITVKQPAYNGIVIVQDPAKTTSLFRNITFKNILIDCTPNTWSSNPCNTEAGGPTDRIDYGWDKKGAIRLQSVENIEFDGLTIIGNAAFPNTYGIRAVNYLSGPSEITVKNSIIVKSTGYGITTVRGNSNYTWHVDNNLFWNNKLGSVGGNAVGHLGANNILNQDPLFVSSSDFHLQSSSPAIDAGIGTSGADLDGNTRPVGSAFDIGAYEWCTGPSCIIAPKPSPYASAPDTTSPTVAISCPSENQTYHDPAASISGTASDNIGISKVEAKVGSGLWQLATGTTSWVVSGLTLAPGSNTITVRVTDTESPGNTVEAAKTVIYDPGYCVAAPALPKRIFYSFNIYDTAVALDAAKAIKADAIVFPLPYPHQGTLTQAGIDKIRATDTAYGTKMQFILWLAPSLDHIETTSSECTAKGGFYNTGSKYCYFNLGNPTIRAARIQQIKDLFNQYSGIDGVHYEELDNYGDIGTPTTIAQREAALNTFFAESTPWIHSKGAHVSFNIANMNTPQDLGIDQTAINANKYVDFILLQSDENSVSGSWASVNGWQILMPNIPILGAAYGWTAATNNACVAAGHPGFSVSSCYAQALFEIIDFYNAQKGISVGVTQVINTSTSVYYPGRTLSYGNGSVYDIIGKIPIKDYSASGCKSDPTCIVFFTATCTDNQQNGDETGKDCGGSCPNACPPANCQTNCPGGCADTGQPDTGPGCNRNCPNNTNQSCSTSSLCTLGQTCQSGSCQGGIARTCNDFNSCTTDSCSSLTGCVFTNNSNSCDDGNLCTQTDSCSGGLCRGTNPKTCADTNACTYDSCDPDTGACTSSNVCGGLVPCGRLVDNPATLQINETAPCDLCSFFYMIKSIINYAAQISFGLAILMFTIAGLLYATSAGDNRKAALAKNTIRYALIGLLFIFLAWLAIAVVLQALGYGNAGTWNQVNCVLR